MRAAITKIYFFGNGSFNIQDTRAERCLYPCFQSLQFR